MATAAQIQAELAAGPQTQAALDAALLKYSPAEMAAAFPQFGNVADFNNAAREAYARTQAQQQAANREAVRADMAAKGEEFRIANPGGDVAIQSAPRPAMSAIPQSEIDAARARLTPEQRNFIDWQIEQTNPMTAQRIGDEYARGGVNPYLDPSTAQAQIDRAKNRQALFDQAGVTPEANLAPWTDPQWREKLQAEQAARAAAQEEARRNPGPFVTGPGPAPVAGPTPVGNVPRPTPVTTPPNNVGLLDTVGAPAPTTTPATPAAPVNPRIAAIQQWYNSNVGRTDPQAQGDLNRFLATSGFTAREINAALPQWGLNDLQNAMRTAIGEVAQQTPFAPVAAQPIRPLAQPYTSIASQLPGGADTRMQEIRNWYAANEGRGTQADLDRWLASGYTAQEINRALPQWGVADLDRAIANARQQFPQAEVQSGLARYQAAAPGAQFTGAVSPYGLIMDQMQPFTNPYADTLANVALGGYRPDVYNVLLDETVDPKTGIAVPNDGGTGGPGDDGSGGNNTASNNAPVENMGTDTGFGGAGANANAPGGGNAAGGAGQSGDGGTGDSSTAADKFKGGLVTAIFGRDPAGPDEGQVNIQRGEYVIKKSSVKKYGQGLLDMINEGKIPAKKIKSLLD